MTPEQLRASILQYAAEGKLVKQNPNDEPASELIKKIEKEKNKLIKEGKIKKNKKLPAIEKDEKPFDIPDSWEWVRLGSILYNLDGKRVPVSVSERNKKGKVYDYYGASGVIDKIDNYIFSKPLLLISEDGANLLARRTPIAFIATGKYWVNNHAHVFDGINLLFLKYISIFIESIDVSKYVTGTAQPKLNQQNLNKILVAVPPLEEQKRIVAKIEKLMPLVDEYAESYNRLQKIDNEFEDKLKQSVLQYAMEGKLIKQDPNDEPASELIKKIETEKAELIKEGKIKKSKKLPVITDDEKPFDIPDSWEWVRLGEIGIVTSGGTPRKAEKSYWDDANIPWITPAVMSKAQNNIIFDNDNVGKINQKGLSNSSAQLISANSIVVSSRAPIGYINIVPFAYTTNQGCKSISTYAKVDSKYVYYAIKFSVPDMYKRASGTTFKEISGTRFGETVIPLPPLEEQKRIITKVEKLQSSIGELSK
ncbi:restriction endonuclease subunit S [Lactobacillus crispatus]|mgnify:CR=1 FL=1|uniref:restriction endonuclease subunit S n=2 Tax=Bacilli TaxID=91061 RepID=UPI00130393AC|nr:restriction endonuclease subunit S [Lactobacillus crispatus]QGY95327.1 restriction endonuclease subunit S [Lactobacillus crispatus]